MNEEEKIFAGRMFDASSSELRAIKHAAHTACRLYNSTDEYDSGRNDIIRSIMGKIGRVFRFQGPVQFNYGKHTFIGENFIANFNLTVMDDGRIYIGDNVCIGPNVSLLATSHPLLPYERIGINGDGNLKVAEYAEEIHIGNNVWIAANVVITGGVTIGDGAVIGAGSVVVKDIPAGMLAVGNPCRPIRKITEADSKRSLILDEDSRKFDFVTK